MLNLINTKQTKKYNTRIKKVYETSFPENEQVPFVMLSLKAKGKISDIFAILDEDKFIGMLCVVYHQDIVFLWYLAIIEEERNKGQGSSVLDWVKQTYTHHRLILNIEEVNKNSEEYEVRKKRKQFYIKNGFYECGFKTEEYGVIYEMLCLGNKISYDEYKEMMIAYSGEIVFNKIYKLVE